MNGTVYLVAGRYGVCQEDGSRVWAVAVVLGPTGVWFPRGCYLSRALAEEEAKRAAESDTTEFRKCERCGKFVKADAADDLCVAHRAATK